MSNRLSSFMQWLSAHLRYVIFVFIIGVTLLFLFVVRGNYYPIAFVNSKPISAHKFLKDFRAASLYYENMVRTYTPTSTPLSGVTLADLEAAVLTQLIEAALVDKATREEVGVDLDRLVQERVSRYEDDAQFRRAVETLYGLDFEDFREEVLVPQAKRDILASRLFFEGREFDEWLVEAKQAASVVLLTKNFFWNGQEAKGVSL